LPESLRVAYWNNIPSPYMVDRFNAVARRAVLDFEAWFSELRTPERSWTVDPESWAFGFRTARVRRMGRRVMGLPPRLEGNARPDIVVSLYAELPYLIGLLDSVVHGSMTALWVEVTFDSWVHRTPFKERLKGLVFPGVDAILTVGDDGSDYAQKYGAQRDRIHLVPHVIDVARFSSESRMTRPARDSLRADLGLRGVTFVYVGRLWAGKGVDHLISAFTVAQRRAASPLSLLLVGDGPDESRLRARCEREGLSGVTFAGFHQQRELPLYYAVSDVFVFPTLGDPYGLVVDEAMACSLPVVSSTSAGEIGGRVVHGTNGLLFRPGDVSALAGHMLTLADDEVLRQRMGVASYEMVSWESSERWAQDFELAMLAIAERRCRDRA
jgi:glycosyltransferase involved in cell wall biosynthesis